MNGALSLKLAISALFCLLTLASPSAHAACVDDSAAAQKAASFAANPSSLLEGPNGPRSPDDVAADVQTFLTSYPQALPAVLNLLKDLTLKGASTSALQKAIGTGLGKAANVCKTTDLAFALEIQGELGAMGSPDANAQYAAITGNDPTRSVALSGATTGAGLGGQTTATGAGAGGSTAQNFVANSVSNKPGNYFSAGASGGGGGSPGGTTTTVVCTVSSTC